MRNTSYDSSDTHVAGAAASEVPTAMVAGRQYELRNTPAAGLWFRIVKAGQTPAAVATDNSHYLAPSAVAKVAAISDRDRVSVIREAAVDGLVCLSEIAETQR